MEDLHGTIGGVIERKIDERLVRVALKRSRVVALLGPRQCGKTTLARQLVPSNSVNYFDLEDPNGAARLVEPDTALRPLKGLVVIDEVQRRPDLFPLLRVLADRKPLPARFLVLGSAAFRGAGGQQQQRHHWTEQGTCTHVRIPPLYFTLHPSWLERLSSVASYV